MESILVEKVAASSGTSWSFAAVPVVRAVRPLCFKTLALLKREYLIDPFDCSLIFFAS